MAAHQQHHSHGPPFISGEEIKSLLHYKDLIPVIERSLVTYSTQKFQFCQPLRAKVISGDKGALFTMPCYSQPDGALTCKLVSVFPGNKDIPSHQGVVAVFDPDTGSLQALMDAEEMTCMRTAAASAVATRRLAKPGSRTLALLGTGAQAFSHFEAIASLGYPLETVRVFSRSAGNRSALADRICKSEWFREGQMQVLESESCQAAVANADIVCTVTSAREPVLHSDWLPAECHVNAVGACRPTDRELDASVTSAAFLLVDSRESALNESGDVILNKAAVHAELGEYLADPGRFQEVRAAHGGRSVFKSLGLGIEDAAAARLVWDRRAAGRSA